MQCVRNTLRAQGISGDAANIIVSSWKTGTQKQYDTIFTKWRRFCGEREITHTESNLATILDFLLEQFKTGIGASSIGTHRSALSVYLPHIDGFAVGEHPTVKRFVKGISNLRPALPRYVETWDSDQVINFIRNMEDETLRNLTLKVVMLLALITSQRAQTLSLFRISQLVIRKDSCTFRILQALKNKPPGEEINILAFPTDIRICPVNMIQKYVEKTKDLRSDDIFFVSVVKPHKAVHVDTIRRWILLVLHQAGIDTKKFKAHSTRSAAASKAANKNVPIEQILNSGKWASDSTFAKFYKKNITETNTRVETFQRAILQPAETMG